MIKHGNVVKIEQYSGNRILKHIGRKYQINGCQDLCEKLPGEKKYRSYQSNLRYK